MWYTCPHDSWVPSVETIYDVNCLPDIPEGEEWCKLCSALPENEDLRDVAIYAVAAKPGSNYLLLGINVLADYLHDRRRTRNRGRVRTFNWDCSIISVCKQVDVSSKLLVGLRSGQHHRIGPFLDWQLARGRSLHWCMSQMQEAMAPQLARNTLMRSITWACSLGCLVVGSSTTPLTRPGTFPTPPS